MFNNERELNEARERGDLDQVYRQLVILGGYQLRGGGITVAGFSYRVSDPVDKRDAIHEAACSLIIQIKVNPSKRIDFWYINMRYAIKDVLKARKKAESITVELREESTEMQEAL